MSAMRSASSSTTISTASRVERAARKEVLEAARARHDDVDALAQGASLRVVPDAAVDGGRAKVAATDPGELPLDLRGELAGGHEDEAGRLARLGARRPRRQGEAEGERLA